MTKALVRLAFQLAPEHHQQLKSLLREHGLVLLAQHVFGAVTELGRPTVTDVCSILFAIGKVSELTDRREALRSDNAWRQLLQDWGERFDRAGSDGMMEYRIELYSAPAGRERPSRPVKPATGGPTTPPTALAAVSWGTCSRTTTATSGAPVTAGA